ATGSWVSSTCQVLVCWSYTSVVWHARQGRTESAVGGVVAGDVGPTGRLVDRRAERDVDPTRPGGARTRPAASNVPLEFQRWTSWPPESATAGRTAPRRPLWRGPG